MRPYLVSVGIPTYNRPNGLRRTLRSIVAQTYQNLEIVISDNCSDISEVEEVICEFMKSDSRIRYFRQTRNMGPTFNLKFVLEKSIGDYFMWAADDDEWDDNFIMKLVEILSGNPRVSIAACQTAYRLVGTNNVFPLFLQGLPFNTIEPNPPIPRLRLAVRENFGELFYGIFRRDSLLDKHSSSIDFESCGLIHAVLKAMLSGDVCVIPEFLFKKDVSEDTFLWTYLCAKSKNSYVMSSDVDDYIKQRINIKRKASAPNLYCALKRVLYSPIKNIYLSIRWHFFFLVSSYSVIFRSKLKPGRKVFMALYMVPYLLRSTAWTVYARIKYMEA